MKTKFKITDKVYFMHNNKVTMGYIQGIHKTCCNFYPPKFDTLLYNTTGYDVYTNGATISKYEDELFSTKEELIESL